MRKYDLSRVYQLLESGPVVLLTTASGGHPNVMTMSWHMMAEFEARLVAGVVSEANFSYAGLRSTREAVIAIPPARSLADQVVKVGNCSGKDIDKFKGCGIDAACGPSGPPAPDRGMLLQS